MSPSPAPRRRNRACSLRTKAPASSADLYVRGSTNKAYLKSGSVTISIKPMPARFKSTRRWSATSWLLAVSCYERDSTLGQTCSTCNCCIPIAISLSTPLSCSTMERVPSLARGSSVSGEDRRRTVMLGDLIRRRNVMVKVVLPVEC
jgi:hypothetical protein